MLAQLVQPPMAKTRTCNNMSFTSWCSNCIGSYQSLGTKLFWRGKKYFINFLLCMPRKTDSNCKISSTGRNPDFITAASQTAAASPSWPSAARDIPLGNGRVQPSRRYTSHYSYPRTSAHRNSCYLLVTIRHWPLCRVVELRWSISNEDEDQIGPHN